MREPYKFFAFISYSHKDKTEAVRLQRMLERYHLPASLRKQVGEEVPRRFKVFRDEDEFTFDELQKAMEEKLRESKYLIVVSSPHSAQSKYVGHEISYFAHLSPDHRRRIIPFIISGDPVTSFHPRFDAEGLELLGIDLQAQGGHTRHWQFHKAFIRMVAGMLELDFSVLWRKRQRFLAKLWTGALLLLALLAGLTAYGLSQRSFDATLTLTEADNHPPLRLSNDGSDYVALYLGKEERRQPISTLDTTLTFLNIHGSFRHAQCSLVVHAYGCQKIDTTLRLEEVNALTVPRDPEIFGRLRNFVLDADGSPLSHATFDFGFLRASTDAQGLLDTLIPLEHQCSEGYHPAIQASDLTPRTLIAPLLPYEDRTSVGTIIVDKP